MQISKIEVNNFRLLNKFKLTPEKDISLIIGKNNTAKTSLLTVLDKFLNYQKNKSFIFSDLNVNAQRKLKELIISTSAEQDTYEPIQISLRIYISYTDSDNIGRLSKVFVDLDPQNNTVVLSYEYELDYENLKKMKDDFASSKRRKDKTSPSNLPDEIVIDKFLNRGIKNYFNFTIKSIKLDHKTNTLDKNTYATFSQRDIEGIISFRYISAKREVSNKSNDSTLSQQLASIFKASENNDAMKDVINDFRCLLVESDQEIGKTYLDIFNDIAKVIEKFGGMTTGDTKIQIMSDLNPEELLKNNATVVYQHDKQNLPEHYNGLGYMNLFSILFELCSTLYLIRSSNDVIPCEVNLLFIEEPEAHTHPQMQYIFIRNIKRLIKEKLQRDDKLNVNLQCFISTHSSHIVANCDFDDIKYLKRQLSNLNVEAKNIRELQSLYEKEGKDGKASYRFLKQYLTINRSELFFTEKAVFVEGDTERILLPAMMKKLDLLFPSKTPLLSQNISIVDSAGSHLQIFSKFIEFIGLKSLIITDIDTYYIGTDEENKTISCPSSDPKAACTYNSALRFFHNRGENKDCEYFLKLDTPQKIVGYDTETSSWITKADGNLFTAYQYSVKGNYGGRSFEDTFIDENTPFIIAKCDKFKSLRSSHAKEFKKTPDPFALAQNGIKSKPAFALDLLIFDNETTTHPTDSLENTWCVPKYIKEGLEWLRTA